MLPLLLVGIFARVAATMNFVDLSGLLAGSTTNPPALTFAPNFARPMRRRSLMRMCIH